MAQTIGPYTLEAFLASGNFSEVWTGRREPDGPEVAIRILNMFDTTPAPWPEQFGSHVDALAAIDHPCLPKILDHGVERTRGYVVTELLAAETLRDTFTDRQWRPWPVQEALDTLTLVCQTLAATVSRVDLPNPGRVITPTNIMLGNKGQVWLLGLTAPHRPPHHLTLTGPVDPDRPYYHYAPEIVRGSVHDGRSDVFAAGAILYTMVTGRLPFSHAEATDFQMLSDILHNDPRLPSSANPTLGKGLDSPIMRSMEKSPDDRQPNIEAFLLDLLDAEITLPHPPLDGPIDAAIEATRDKLYTGDRDALAAALLGRSTLSEEPALTAYLWDHLEDWLTAPWTPGGGSMTWTRWQLARALPETVSWMKDALEDPAMDHHPRRLGLAMLQSIDSEASEAALVALKDGGGANVEALAALEILREPPSSDPGRPGRPANFMNRLRRLIMRGG